jgi:hypothetical protein
MGTKHVPEALLIQDPSLMFEMGTGRLLVHDGAGGTAKTVLEQAAEDSAAAAARQPRSHLKRHLLLQSGRRNYN